MMKQKVVVRERIDGCLCCHEGKQRMREESAGVQKMVKKIGGWNGKGAEEVMLGGDGRRRQLTPN